MSADRAPRDEREDEVWPDPAADVSVIVVHHEQHAALARTLDALAAQTHPPDRMEVIVVDDGSRRAPAVGDAVRLVVAGDRGGRAGAARNLGARLARGSVLCFLDADTAPEPEYVRRLTRLPALVADAVTVGRRRHTALALGSPLARASEHELPEPAWLRAGYAATRDLRDADERSYRFVISAVLACTRAFFDEVGPFAAFDRYGGEDWEWAHRAWRAGALLAHVPDAVAWHDGPDFAARADLAQRRIVKNAETRRLASLIGVSGSRGRGLRPARAETVVHVDDAGTPSQAFRCVDGILAALPDAIVVLAADAARPFAADSRVRAVQPDPDPDLAWPALRLRVHRPLAVIEPGLSAACAEVARDRLARLVLTDASGPLLTLADGRADARARRHGDAAALAGRWRSASGCALALEPEPDLEAWVGGWAN